MLFGDGAGAVVLRAERGTGTPFDRGVLATHLGSDGRHYDDLYVDGGPSSTGTTGHLRMNGREVFRHAIHELTAATRQVLGQLGLAVEDVDWLVPHQANIRILEGVGRRLEIPPERVLVTVDRHANTSAASIPLALAEADGDGRLRAGSTARNERDGRRFYLGCCGRPLVSLTVPGRKEPEQGLRLLTERPVNR